MTDLIRRPEPADLPALAAVLTEQQPTSHYPFRRPLPFPIKEFIQRDGELAAWTALHDGRPVGHVCVQQPAGSAGTNAVSSDALTSAWTRGHIRPVAELAVVSALFTATSVRGTGIGGRLLDTTVAWIHQQGLAPCLDVVQGPSPAAAIYQARGWQIAGEIRPDWLPEQLPPVLAMILPTERR